MIPISRSLALRFALPVAFVLGLALPGQGGLAHESGWLPAPAGAIVRTRFADMNGDGFQDLVRMRSRAVELLLQDPVTGRFVRASTSTLSVSTPELRDIAIGRLDASNDVLPDVAVLWANGDVDVLRNNSGIGLVREVPRPVPALPSATGAMIFAADLSGDLVDDLLVVLEATPPQLLEQQGAGNFVNTTGTTMPVAIAYPRPRAVLADTDGDNDLDLVLASTNTLPPTLLENQNGSFAVDPTAFSGGAIATGAILAVDLAGSPLPELLFGPAGTAANMPVVLNNNAGAFTAIAVTQSLRVRGVTDLAALDIDQDGREDVLFLEPTGKVGYALRGAGGMLVGQPTGTANLTEPIPLLGVLPGRVAIDVADLEGDGDVDIVAGGDVPDSLLLHGSASDFHDTERVAFPVSRRATNYAPVLVDRDFNGDTDLIGLYPSGEWLALDNDGSGYFRDLGPTTGVLPALPNVTIWEDLMRASIQTAGQRDLVALGDGSGVANQIAVLVKSGAGWVDETATRFGGPVTGIISTAAVYSHGSGPDSLVLGTFSGELEFHENVGGALVHQPGRFPASLGLFNLTQLLVADFSGDGEPDILALQSGNRAPRLFVATGSGFVAAPVAVPLTARGDRGVVANVDLDSDFDVLLRTTGQPGLSAMRWNRNTNSFLLTTLGAISTVNFEVSDMAVVRVDGAPRIVLGRAVGPDAIYAWNGSNYVGPSSLGYRGTPATRELLTADLERDGDIDVLALRDGLDPVVLNNGSLGLDPRGPVASGRAGQVVLRSPAPGSLAFVSYGLPLNTPTPWGLLRLDPGTMGTIFLGAPPGREVTWNIPLASGLPWIRFPIQGAWITPASEVVLSGLEHLVILP
ncbi:MAG: VCBS repeat-containing protein [bacterium]|nr:VCBS repeat-containing protein [bacterium]